jgi:hypothetical protein
MLLAHNVHACHPQSIVAIHAHLVTYPGAATPSISYSMSAHFSVAHRPARNAFSRSGCLVWLRPWRAQRCACMMSFSLVNAYCYVMRTGSGWRRLPPEFPPWQTVHWHVTQWRRAGILAQMWHILDEGSAKQDGGCINY